MSAKQTVSYTQIAEAIEYLKDNSQTQLRLDETINVHPLNSNHIEQLFMDWIEISPQKFMQIISARQIKNNMIKQPAFDLEQLAQKSQTHSQFVHIENMTADEYQNGGKNLDISYSFSDSIFGNLIIASTSKGVCYLAFDDDNEQALYDLKQKFPQVTYQLESNSIQEEALDFLQDFSNEPSPIRLHIYGTDFQLQVWNELLKIPMGQLTSYGVLANKIGNPSSSRSVGTAIGSNPVAYLIPCHRVVQSTGHFGGYRWGSTRKTVMIGWEIVQTQIYK